MRRVIRSCRNTGETCLDKNKGELENIKNRSDEERERRTERGGKKKSHAPKPKGEVGHELPDRLYS